MTGKAIRPFEHLNLRRNPFGELPSGVGGALAVVDAAPIVDWLGKRARAVQFVGASGRGKTTHLRALDRRLSEVAYVRIRRDEPPPTFPEAGALLVDELQFLPRDRRADLYRHYTQLAIGTHDSFAGELREAGFAVKSVRVGEVSTERLAAIFRRRIEWARRGPGPVPELSEEAIATLHDQHGSDIRAMEHHLYEVFQQLDGPRTIGCSDLNWDEDSPRAR